jgi:acyl-CoA reductase-like NAD-dependent aldehyde dehydrogenase
MRPSQSSIERTGAQHEVRKVNETLLLIGNRDVAASSGATFDRLSPLDGSIATRAAAAGVDDASAAAAAAQAALPGWAALGPGARRMLLLKAADELQRRGGAFAAAMRQEIGATAAWAGFNVQLAAGMLREAAALTSQISGEVIPSDQAGCLAMTLRRPAGVVLGIAPWNAPVILGVRAIATPLACGNTVILKASETCPATHRLIGEALREAGLPAGTVNVVTNAPADAARIVATLIAHPAIRRINFTGSTAVGKIIAKLAADQLKPVLLELGGKAPLIVLEDADLDAAVAAAAFGAYMNSGQICMSTERIIVAEAIAEVFLTKLRAKVSTLVAGDPGLGATPLGSVADAAAASRVQALIDDAVSKGAQLHQAAPADGTLLSAAVLDRVTPAMRIYSEESFGPVATVLRAASDEEAVRLANDTEYGLTSAVFSKDIARALRIAEQIDAGMCHINGATVHDEAQMPFGGTKQSGYGRFGGKAGIAEFTELRWITIATQPGRYPI